MLWLRLWTADRDEASVASSKCHTLAPGPSAGSLAFGVPAMALENYSLLCSRPVF